MPCYLTVRLRHQPHVMHHKARVAHQSVSNRALCITHRQPLILYHTLSDDRPPSMHQRPNPTSPNPIPAAAARIFYSPYLRDTQHTYVAPNLTSNIPHIPHLTHLTLHITHFTSYASHPTHLSHYFSHFLPTGAASPCTGRPPRAPHSPRPSSSTPRATSECPSPESRVLSPESELGRQLAGCLLAVTVPG